MSRPGPLRNRPPETVTIIDLSHEGRGVARVDGKAIFVDDVLPGEVVEIVRVRRQRSYDEAKLQRVITPSADRVTPRCVHFGMCGGCALQHMDSAQQRTHKEKQLLEELQRIGHVAPERVLPPLHAKDWNYRRRARLGVRWVPKKDRALVGFRERSTHYLAQLDGCTVLRPPLDQLLAPLSAMITTLASRARIAQIEAAVGDHVTALVFRNLDELSQDDRARIASFGDEHNVQMFLQPGGYETIAPLVEQRQQFPALSYRLPAFDVDLQFKPADFVQVHGELNNEMTKFAVELLQIESSSRVLDLFCGIGNFSLPIARHAEHVVGLEGDAGLVRRAQENATRNSIANAEFIAANLFEDQTHATWAQRKYDRVLIDPPRAGAREILPIVVRTGANRIVYVSCHPGSLARDAGILVNEYQFKLRAAGIMDMFPQTAHVESIAVFET